LRYGEDLFPEVLRDLASDAWAPDLAADPGADGAMFGRLREAAITTWEPCTGWLLVPVYTIKPSEGPAAGGFSAEVYAWNFDSGASLRIGGIVPADVVVDPLQRTITATVPAFPPGTLQDVQVSTRRHLRHRAMVSSRGLRRPVRTRPFHWAVARVFRAGVTAGCGNGNFCGGDAVRRDQMAVFLLKAEHGSDYTPPPCEGLFSDVACGPSPSFAADWSSSCSARRSPRLRRRNFCPDPAGHRVRRWRFSCSERCTVQPGRPPAASACSKTSRARRSRPLRRLDRTALRGQHHRRLLAEPAEYCPDQPVLRKQMAVFLVKTFPFTL
jgi:hypothetical protein